MLYYLVLVCAGLGVAALLFGALQSVAHYQGRAVGGALEMGGPFAAFIIFLVVSWKLVPSTSDFSATIYVHGAGGPQDVVLRNSGQVVLDLGSNRRQEPIGDRGQAYFPSIPSNFRGQQVYASVEANAFEVEAKGYHLVLNEDGVYLPVSRKSGTVVGRVQNEQGASVESATVNILNIEARVDRRGFFKLVVPGRSMRDPLTIRATALGYLPASYPVVAGGSDAIIVLRRKQ